MKISEALTKAKIKLEKAGAASFGLDSLILLGSALSFSKEQIIFNPDLEISEEQERQFFDLVERRTNREPTSHLIGKREFFGRDFEVGGDVLDPRPDSEHLIELVLKKLPNHAAEIDFLEVGVGSGCLIISLLSHYKNAHGFGLDISARALDVANRNSQKHEVEDRLELLESDLFSGLKFEKKFEVIISNPPYIPTVDILDLEPEVKDFEPMMALDGGVDGLDFYRRIAADCGKFLKKDGRIFLEIGIGQREEIEHIFRKEGFTLLTVKKDFGQIERILEFRSI